MSGLLKTSQYTNKSQMSQEKLKTVYHSNSILFFSSQYKDQMQLIQDKENQSKWENEIVSKLFDHFEKLGTSFMLEGNMRGEALNRMVESLPKHIQLRYSLEKKSLVLLQDTDLLNLRIKDLAVFLKRNLEADRMTD